MKNLEGEREYLAAARQKYTNAMKGVILRLLGIQWDVEEDMRELAKEYEKHFPLTALLLYAQPGYGKSPRGLYWAWRMRAIYKTQKDGRVMKLPIKTHLAGGLTTSRIFHVSRRSALTLKYLDIGRRASALNERRKAVVKALASISKMMGASYTPVIGLPGEQGGGDSPSLLRDAYRDRVTPEFSLACECGLGLAEALAGAELGLRVLSLGSLAKPADARFTMVFSSKRPPWGVGRASWEVLVGGRMHYRHKLTKTEMRTWNLGVKEREGVMALERERRVLERARRKHLGRFHRMMQLGKEITDMDEKRSA